MASSNRHWPSMFKSKPTCNTHHHHQWQSHDSNNLLSSACHRSPYTSGCEERSPEPKPRWNPKPEQIRILESIFNSGMVNPPRDEIRKIRAQLQEYGQVGDANVFYWFQNRKSRSKHKNRNLQKSQNNQPLPATTKVATTSSSSSSEKSSSKSIEFLLNSPTASVNQQAHAYFGGGGGAGYHHQQHHGEFSQEPFFYSTVQHPSPPPPATTTTAATATASFTEGFCFSELGSVINEDHSHGNLDETVGSGSEMLLTDLMMMNHQNGMQKSNNSNKGVEEEKMMKLSSYNFTPPPVPLNPTTTAIPSTVNIQGVDEPAPGKLTVFINDVPFEVAVGPFNVREAFGDDAVLVHSYGQPVATNEWGVTLHSLLHGAVYYLVRSFSFDHSNTIDLI